MAKEYSPYKMKGHTLPGIKQNPSSPLNKVNEAGKWIKTKHQKKLIKNYDEHKSDPSYQKALTGAFGGKTTYDSKTGIVSIEKGAPDKSSSPATFAWAAAIPAVAGLVGKMIDKNKEDNK